MAERTLTERRPGTDELGFRPEDGALSRTNPPSFVWLPIPEAVAYELEISLAPDFPAETTLRFTDIDLSIFTPSVTLEAGRTYYWRYRYVDARGNRSAPSPVRSFRIASDAVELPLPPMDELHDRLPKGHPRLFVRPETVEALRSFRSSARGRIVYQNFLRPLITSLMAKQGEPLPPEPGNPYSTGAFDADVWRAGMQLCRTELDTIQQLAFDYMLTGAQDVGAEAKRRLLHVMSWDPAGNTSAKINDECSMAILWGASRAYTWLYDLLTPEERARVRDVMRIRGEEAYRMMRELPFESKPFHSHLGRTLGFLGEAAIAFFGEFPEAEKWFDYIVKIFYAVYPAWGGEAGGWAEGTSYWKYYMSYVSEFVDALSVATGLDLVRKPFFQQTGMFKLYTHSLGSGTAFGDGLNEGVTELDAQVMDWLGRRTGNGYLRWYAASAPGNAVKPGFAGFFALTEQSDVQPKAPTDLPPSRLFDDVGWVAMLSDLVNPQNGIRLIFKSSPYGSYSHSHADQNAFVLDAFGVPLAISAGYYDWYMSPHHSAFTQESRSKNTILVNGQGQKARSLDAKGKIEAFFHSSPYDYTRGNAAQAYDGRLERFDRHILFLRPHLVVIFDELAAPEPAHFTWLLHAWAPFAIDEAEASARLSYRNVRLDVKFLQPEGLRFTQTDVSDPPPSVQVPVQWHLQAETAEPRERTQFLTVLAPVREVRGPNPGELLEVTAWNAAPADGGSALELTYVLGDGSVWRQVIAFAHQSDAAGGVSGKTVAGDGRAMAYGYDEGTRQTVFVAGGTYLEVVGATILRASAPLTLAAAWDEANMQLWVADVTDVPVQVWLASPFRLRTVTVNGVPHEAWSYDGRGVVIELQPANARGGL